MRCQMPGRVMALAEGETQTRSIVATRFDLDPWIASSLLQKAIRRGDADLAERAAITLHHLRGNGLWRRFIVIAFEDVGVASPEALVETVAACSNKGWRVAAGGDVPALRRIARLLALAPKDRSPDYLICAAHSHPAFEAVRDQVGAMSIAQRLDVVSDQSRPLPVRAIAAWYASGINWGDEHRVGRGDLQALMHQFRHLGVLLELLAATNVAAKRTKEPIVIMAPLLWLAASADLEQRANFCLVPPVTIVGEIPTYAFDKHTAIGKAAIHRLARENEAVRAVLAEHVPEYRVQKAACMAAFYADAAPVSRKFIWQGSIELEQLGTETDMLNAGVPLSGIEPVLKVVRENLDHLNTIRAEMFARRRATGG